MQAQGLDLIEIIQKGALATYPLIILSIVSVTVRYFRLSTSCSALLHPTIGVHTPLTFDIVDRWMKRSLGGCQYHVMHPGGRSYEVFPVNAFEAESRRLERFFRIGHSPGTVEIGAARVDSEFPFTLDLRKI
jgi:uncharacterized protein (DUF2126 family)